MFKLYCHFNLFIILCHYSSEDPFEYHYIRNLTNYFKNVENITNLTAKLEKKCKSNDEEIVKFSKEEQILNESKNDSSESTINKKLFLRRLVSTSYCRKLEVDLIYMRVESFQMFLSLI